MKQKKRATSSNQYRKRRSAARKTRQNHQNAEMKEQEELSSEDSVAANSQHKKKKQEAKPSKYLVREVDSKEIGQDIDEKHEFFQKINDKQEKRRKKTRLSKVLKFFLWLLLIFFIGLCLFYAYVFDMTTIKTNEMSQTLQVGEKVLYRQGDVGRFSIVKIDKEGKHYWSRVIGVPGDTLEMENDTLYINGLEYEESYLKSNYLDFKLNKKNLSKNYTKSFTLADFSKGDQVLEVIPDGYYLVLSDDRESDVDSRYTGLVSEKDIDGIGTLIVWPPSSVGVIK